MEIWMRARIPVQRIDSCIRSLEKLNIEYQARKKSRKKTTQGYKDQDAVFQSTLVEVFNIGTQDALSTMKSEEDQEFYQKQLQDVFSCSMAGEDMVTAGKEGRKRSREEEGERRRRRYEEREARPSQGAVAALPSTTSSSQESQDEEYHPTPSTSTTTALTPKRTKNIFTDPEVAGALDRVNLTDRKGVFVVGAVASALGHDLSVLTLSRSSVRRSRRLARSCAAAQEEKDFTVHGPLLLHWDGKLLPDVTGEGDKYTADRVAVLVTSPEDFEKLLGVPKVERGTGEAQAAACVATIDQWALRSKIRGLVFDTTASNTGLHNGACTIIEETLGRELVWIPCRHHILELLLSAAFRSAFGPTAGPETGLFKRFKKEWGKVNQAAFVLPTDEVFEQRGLQHLRTVTVDYLERALQGKQPRADYRELLLLSYIFLGGKNIPATFRSPGAAHHARWMAKALYSLKLFLFQSQVKSQIHVTARDAKALLSLSLFSSLLYARAWNEAPVAANAPLNDLRLLQAIKSYPDTVIAQPVTAAFERHLWFLSEHLAGLAFFDQRVSLEVKRRMVARLLEPKMVVLHRRVPPFEDGSVTVDQFITRRSATIFDLLMEDGKKTAREGFLLEDPSCWREEETFIALESRATKLRVVNDAAERAIALIEQYNSTLTKDEEQKQLCLRLVSEHRRRLPGTPTKAALSSTKQM